MMTWPDAVCCSITVICIASFFLGRFPWEDFITINKYYGCKHKNDEDEDENDEDEDENDDGE
jgi:hypothetical protein